MIKKLLSLVILFAFVATAGAAGPKENRLPNNLFKNSIKHATSAQMMKAPAALQDLELEPGQAWFGYWDPSDPTNLGTGTSGDYALGIYVPYDKVAGKGATVDGVRFFLPTTIGISNVKVWASTKLADVGHYSDGYDLEIKEVETIAEGYNEFVFSKKFEIPEGGLYLGFSFDSEIDLSEYPPEDYSTAEEYYAWYEKYMAWLAAHPEAEPFTITFGDKLFEGSMYFASNYYDDLYKMYAEMTGNPAYLQYVGWNDFTDYGYYLGFEALIGGDKFLNNAASFADFGEKYIGVNQDVTFPVTLTNSGKNGIQNFTYEVAIDGTKVDEKTITLERPINKILDYTTVNVTFNSGEQTGTKNIEMTITKVNGEANEKNDVAKGTIIVLSEFAQMKPLVEEYTGTWCGWCTRGWVGLELLAEDFKDQAVLIASHNGDPMEIDEYMDVQQKYIQGYPSMLINRLTNVDPYNGSSPYEEPYYIKNDVEAFLASVAPASIAVQAEWADQEKTKINISTESKFFYDINDPTMAIGYILVADGLQGTGRSWAQANYYCEYAEEYGNDPYLGELTKMGSYITDMIYNHVAVAGWGVLNGVDGSISGPIKSGEPINCTFEADLNGLLIGEDRVSSDPEDHVTVLDMIQEKKLSVVAFLINQTTGEVINADQVVLQEEPGVSIAAIEQKAGTETVRYNVSGQLIKAPQSGLNIIRLSDGTTLKVFVK